MTFPPYKETCDFDDYGTMTFLQTYRKIAYQNENAANIYQMLDQAPRHLKHGKAVWLAFEVFCNDHKNASLLKTMVESHPELLALHDHEGKTAGDFACQECSAAMVQGLVTVIRDCLAE